MAWMLVETSNVAEKSELYFAGIVFRRAKGSGTTKALRNFEIVYLLDNGILGALGTSPSISTDSRLFRLNRLNIRFCHLMVRNRMFFASRTKLKGGGGMCQAVVDIFYLK